VYYWATAYNALVRLWWVLPYVGFVNKNNNWIKVLAMMLEIIRRAIWAVLRVENEFFNNYEKYRTILTIPPMERPVERKKSE
jgi:hypothetical protein